MYADITEGQSYTINVTLGDLSGLDAFQLVSTYGFPFELISKFVQEKNGSINEKEYQKQNLSNELLLETVLKDKIR